MDAFFIQSFLQTFSGGYALVNQPVQWGMLGSSSMVTTYNTDEYMQKMLYFATNTSDSV